jgi:hypothetical protein
MKRWPVLLLITIILAFSAISSVTASGDPVGACPNSFHLHEAMDHDHNHNGQHKHVGNDRDLNDDGWICGKHVGANDSVHVHIDNNLPLP